MISRTFRNYFCNQNDTFNLSFTIHHLIMTRFLLLFCFALAHILPAQTILWTGTCTNRTVCINPGQCATGYALLTESAVTTCQAGSYLSYSYKLDLQNDGTTDMQAAEDTLIGNFPIGTHRISWRANDNCGKVSTCSYMVIVKDCQPPNLICINGLTQQVSLPDCATSFAASQFILSLSDNCTPTNQLQLGIRAEGAGTGFPATSSMTYDKCQQGLHTLEVWARDGTGLNNSCIVYVIIQQLGDDCKCTIDGDIRLKGCVHTRDNKKVSDYRLLGQVQSTGGTPPATNKKISAFTSDSCFDVVAAPNLPLGNPYRIMLTGQRDGSALNGVSTYDLVLISKHILGLEPFPTLYQALAADANRSNSITTFDIVELRKLILGIYDTLPATKPWRFVQAVANPNIYTVLEAAKDTILLTIPNLQDDVTLSGIQFVAIKIGDLNNSVITNFDDPSLEDRDALPVLPLSLPNLVLEAGQAATLPVRFATDAPLTGWQLALAADPARLQIEGVEGLPDDHWTILPDGSLRALWHNGAARNFQRGEIAFSLKVKSLQKTVLAESLVLQAQPLRAEAYGATGERQAVQLTFSGDAPVSTPLFFPPQPNPTTGTATFQWVLPEPAQVRLELWDAAARQTYVTTFQGVGGANQWIVPAEGLPQDGTYFFRLTAAEGVYSGRLVKQ